MRSEEQLDYELRKQKYGSARLLGIMGMFWTSKTHLKIQIQICYRQQTFDTFRHYRQYYSRSKSMAVIDVKKILMLYKNIRCRYWFLLKKWNICGGVYTALYLHQAII